jgi:divalent metal cation (Fe/Co/Zn/Cd) transporter
VALFLARESKGLLIGEPADSAVVASICRIARAQGGVERANGLFTVHLGPEQIVAAITADFTDSLSAADVEAAVAAIEDRVRAAHPEILLLLVKPQGTAALERVRACRSER